jgi:hypothetical protein
MRLTNSLNHPDMPKHRLNEHSSPNITDKQENSKPKFDNASMQE